MARWKISYSNKKFKPEIVSAKTKLDALNKAKDVPGAFFKIRKLPKKRRWIGFGWIKN